MFLLHCLFINKVCSGEGEYIVSKINIQKRRSTLKRIHHLHAVSQRWDDIAAQYIETDFPTGIKWCEQLHFSLVKTLVKGIQKKRLWRVFE